jgi:VanZ family protein
VTNRGYVKIFYWLPAVIWMVVIFGFSSRPSLHASAVDWQDFIIKKSAHLGEYFILGILVYNSLKKTSGFNSLSLLLLTITITVLYAVTDEYHQTFISGREGKIRDVAIDGLGSVIALLTIRVIGL